MVSGLPVTCSAGPDAVRVAARYGPRTAHVETIGTLYSGKRDVGGGSGLLVGDRYVLTNDHVIPDDDLYEALQINVRLRSRLLAPLEARVIERDHDRDLALLELAEAVASASGEGCPMPVMSDASRFPMGSSILFLGYPVDRDLSITSGILSNQGGDDGRWQTDASINYGNSGGPAFDSEGDLVGIAVGGIVDTVIGGETKRVQGVNFLIPVAVVERSPVFARIAKTDPAIRCWRDAEAGIATAKPDQTRLGIAPAPSLIRDYAVSVTKDDHPSASSHSRTYEIRYSPEPGYRLDACEWHGDSENHQSDLVCNIGPGGSAATFEFRLTSGPFYDRWRGWLHGTIALKQEVR